jgi:hypothetical protein
MDRLWQVLLRAVEDGPLSCEDCIVLMDQITDLLASGYPLDDLLSVANRYLQRCPDCQTALQEALTELAMTHQETNSTREIARPTAI